MTVLKDIQNQIITTLKAGTVHSIVGDNVFYGTTMSRAYPVLFVTWKGGPLQSIDMTHKNWIQDFNIIALDAAASGDVPEQRVQGIAEAVIIDLKANPTLSGKVTDSEVIALEGDSVAIGTDFGKTNQILAGCKITLRVTFLLESR